MVIHTRGVGKGLSSSSTLPQYLKMSKLIKNPEHPLLHFEKSGWT